MNRVSSNALVEKLRHRITTQGPITFREWMDAALYDPVDGYYCASDRQRSGREGDYRTNPERTSLFAVTFADYFSNLYQQLGLPSTWTMFESGAGQGDFAIAVLERLKHSHPQVYSATNYVIDEISTANRESTRTRLQSFSEKTSVEPIEALETFAGVIFANELLDAFPIHRIIRVEEELREFFVGLDANNEFEWRLGPLSDERISEQLERLGVSLQRNQIAEINLLMEEWLHSVSKKLKKGFVVLVDYGAEAEELFAATRLHGTLRAFYRHRFVRDLLNEPGKYDLTASVNWTAVRQTSEALGFQVIQFEPQNEFLIKAGLLNQLESIVETTSDEAEKARLRSEAREMILPGGMAEYFQVLVLSIGI
jgi:SAM-dependent MidA family methyltransferase